MGASNTRGQGGWRGQEKSSLHIQPNISTSNPASFEKIPLQQVANHKPSGLENCTHALHAKACGLTDCQCNSTSKLACFASAGHGAQGSLSAEATHTFDRISMAVAAPHRIGSNQTGTLHALFCDHVSLQVGQCPHIAHENTPFRQLDCARGP